MNMKMYTYVHKIVVNNFYKDRLNKKDIEIKLGILLGCLYKCV